MYLTSTMFIHLIIISAWTSKNHLQFLLLLPRLWKALGRSRGETCWVAAGSAPPPRQRPRPPSTRPKAILMLVTLSRIGFSTDLYENSLIINNYNICFEFIIKGRNLTNIFHYSPHKRLYYPYLNFLSSTKLKWNLKDKRLREKSSFNCRVESS